MLLNDFDLWLLGGLLHLLGVERLLGRTKCIYRACEERALACTGRVRRTLTT